jgi:hypothetical protein
MKTNINFLLYLAQFLESEILVFQEKIVEEIRTRILFSITFLSKIVPFVRQCGKIL